MPLFCWLITFYILGQKFVKFFVVFLENLRLSKRQSEINWPLACLLTFLGKKPSSLDLLHTVFPSQISSTAVKFLLDIQHNSYGKLFLIYFPLCLSRRLYIDENDISYLHISMPLLVWRSFAELRGEKVRQKVCGNGL